MRDDQRADTGHVTARQPIYFTQRRRPLGAVQIENRLASLPDDMDVSRSMITGIDHKSQTGSP